MLSSKQKKCIEMMVVGTMNQTEIANILHVTPTTICNWKRNDEFRSEYDDAVKGSIKDAAAKAFSTECKLLSARSEMVRLGAAKDILDRAGFKADEKVNVSMDPVMIVSDLKE